MGGSDLTALRREVDERMARPDPDFAVRYVQERLAVLDGDVDRIVELLGGDLTSPYQFIRVAEAMLELYALRTPLHGRDAASTRPAVGRSRSSTTSLPA